MKVFHIFIEDKKCKSYEHYKTFATVEGAVKWVENLIEKSKRFEDMRKVSESYSYCLWTNMKDDLYLWILLEELTDVSTR
jgi:hypothetical protein